LLRGKRSASHDPGDPVVRLVAIELQRESRLGIDAGPFDVPDRMLASGVTGLAIEPSHALGVAAVDGQRRDLIDRLLIAQATVEDMALVTADPNLPNAAITTIEATR